MNWYAHHKSRLTQIRIAVLENEKHDEILRGLAQLHELKLSGS